MHNELDIMLQRRQVPMPPTNLAERIIAASLVHQRSKKSALVDLWKGFSDLFIIPQPAFALALALIIGISVGGIDDRAHAFLMGKDEVISSYKLVDESYENGAFQ